jgi:hypothetical protein
MIGSYEERIGAKNTKILREELAKELTMLKDDMLKITKTSGKILNTIPNEVNIGGFKIFDTRCFKK